MKKYDVYLEYLYQQSSRSVTTQHIYKKWVRKCCHYHQVTHPLDLTPEDLNHFRAFLLREKHFSNKSDTIVYNAFKHTFLTLLSQVEPDQSKRYAHLFVTQPRQPRSLPGYVSQEEMSQFIETLPNTVAGNIIRGIYETSRKFEDVRDGGRMTWKCSKAYAQHVAAKTARKVGIPHGFGLTGVRSASILHRIQNRTNDIELSAIQQDSRLSSCQFELYLRAAGFYSAGVNQSPARESARPSL